MSTQNGTTQDGTSAAATSTPTSPTDTRRPLPRYESIVAERDDFPASFQSTDTVRRRPEGQQSGYGTIPPQTGPEHRPSDASQLSDRPHLPTLETSRSIQQLRSPRLGPERGRAAQRAKKPALSRRTSANMGPHRGQEFSVDDDVTEIEEAMANRLVASTGFGTMRLPQSSLRRRPTVQTILPRVDSYDEEEAPSQATNEPAVPSALHREVDAEETGAPPVDLENAPTESDVEASETSPDDDEGDLSDAESFTLKDRQEAINETHPFGIRIWKPALYKKNRSVQKTAEGDIHSAPGGRVHKWLILFNLLWTLWFGWWLALVAFAGAVVCFCFAAAPSAVEYCKILWGLSWYLLYPFGKFVRLEQDEAYAHEDEGEGRSITEYEQWQSGDIEDGRLFFGPQPGDRSIIGRSRRSIDSAATESDSLLGRTQRGNSLGSPVPRTKRRLFGRGQWNLGRVIFFLFFYGLITPSLFVVSGICWFMVFWIPMGKVTMLLFYHLRRHPLALSFQSDTAYSRGSSDAHSSILLCTYRAVGLKYWKYTVDGTNIFLINLMAVVLFVIFDYWVLLEALELRLPITQSSFLFVAALLSIIPLAYFIGQAVASISAQSSMGLGAAINAFFSTIVEVYLYCVALNQGKGQLVEGSIIGSIFAGILFLPGLSMCFGAIKRKTQRFNAKSAGVTSTMLLFAVIAAFGPTLFYQINGSHELNCKTCEDSPGSSSRDCRWCYFSQTPALDDRFYLERVRPYCWLAAALLFLSYIIGLWFTLRTHAAVIWNMDIDEKKQQAADAQQSTSLHESMSHRLQRQSTNTDVNDMARSGDIRETQLYKRILGQSLKQVGFSPKAGDEPRHNSVPEQLPNHTPSAPQTPHMVPPKSAGGDSTRSDLHIPGFTDVQDISLVREVAEIAATAATIAARDAVRGPRKPSGTPHSNTPHTHRPPTIRAATAATILADDDGPLAADAHDQGGGHDAPNWSRTKSAVILLGATVLYALIAEILVNTVDVVLAGNIDEKFLGITLFALVPNTTEFLNAISFAMNGNIALSMEIGSAYALQVCLLQIPALVLFSAVRPHWAPKPITDPNQIFSLIFPQWDMVTVILCVFLLSYMYGEGKSNYFKGSILLLSYLVVVVGFWFSPSDLDSMSTSRFELPTSGGTFRTIGRRSAGYAFAMDA